MLLRAVAMRFGATLFGAWVALLAVSAARATGPVDFSETMYSNGDPVTVNFKTWAPDGWDRLKGVVFDIPGSGGDTRDVTYNTGWQQRLSNMGFAIIGVQFQYTNFANWYWGADPQEIAANMQTMLDGTADALSHAEISNAPMFLNGISHGARATSAIAQSIPERTLGFVSDKGDVRLFNYTVDTGKVPGLFVLGAYDTTVPPMFVSDAYDSWRVSGSEVAQLVDWYGHGTTNPSLKHAFMDEVIKLRYPEGQFPSLVPGNPLPLVNIPYEEGWRGETNPVDLFSGEVTHIPWPEIGTADQAGGVLGDGSWLPSETMARVFRAHNSDPVGIAKNKLQLNVGPPDEIGPPLDIVVGIATGSYDGIELYDESGLIAEFGPGSGFQEFPYTPTELGNQTFIAVMEYTYNGQTEYASTYLAYNITYAPEQTVLWGDYNDNGIIDGADYTAWRDALDAPGSSLLNDPTPLGVSEQDFVYWRSHFGETLLGGGSSADSPAAAPEPTSALLLSSALVLLSFSRRR